MYEKQGRRADAVRAYALALHAERPDAAIRNRLAALIGGSDHVDAALKQYDDARESEWRVAVPAAEVYKGAADFVVLFDNNPRGPVLELAVFYRGDEDLRPLTDAVSKASFDAIFPDDTPAKMLLRGTLSCAPPEKSCQFRLTPTPDLEAAGGR